jgi:adenine-specific DNA-methyltransferase
LVPETIWTYQEVGHTQVAKKEVIRILGGTDAPVTPKPVTLVEQILRIASEPGDVILDSCAGTGTTGHSVLGMNAESPDQPPRHFVLVQQAQDTKDNQANNLNLCESLTAARVRRVITGYDYVKRGAKGKKTELHQDGLGGSFTYARLGEPLFGEYKNFGEELPPYDDIAKYIFYTETSREFPGASKKQNPAWDKKAGRIGEHAGRSYYLLYEPNEREDRGLDRSFLKDFASDDPNAELIVYCERIAVHQEELRKFRREHGKRIRPMLVPFNLK